MCLLFKVDFLKSYSDLDKLEIMSKQIKISQDLRLNSVCITENKLSVRSYQGLTMGRCVASLAFFATWRDLAGVHTGEEASPPSSTSA